MKKIALLALCAALSAGAVAADEEVENLLANMRKAYKTIGTVTFKLESTVLTANGDIVIKMIGGFRSPNMMYVNIDLPGARVKVVSDGKKVYSVRGDSERIREMPYNIDVLGDALLGANLEVINFYDWERQLSTSEGANMHDSTLSIRKNEKWNGKTWLVLEESAPKVDVYVEYYIDPKTNLVWRTVQMSLDKEFTRGDFILKSLKMNAKISDKRFQKPIRT
ncbi:MAG: hypothetical protein IH945_04585 [Armatimonadetes bacterium]|nr:hypothetical protein [Armatimonadota bacterium]